MSRRWLAGMMLIAALSFPATLMADHGRGKDKGNPHSKHDFDDHGRRGHHDDDRWERRDKYEYRIYSHHDGRPPGWSQGRKTGWANCGLPPGQAKKYGCRTYVYQGRPHYYYQDEVGRIIVRRPSIEFYGGVVIH
jgi:hypothetical protein